MAGGDRSRIDYAEPKHRSKRLRMDWERSPEALAETFYQALPEDPRVVRRKTFGYPSAVVGGHMFASLHVDKVVIRLPDAARNELLARPNAKIFEPMAGRPMREYVVAPTEIVDDPAELRRWLEKAFAYATELPEKERKPAKPRKRSV
jgi:TfoX/Sxy family transcriptional regulator of competence genes